MAKSMMTTDTMLGRQMPFPSISLTNDIHNLQDQIHSIIILYKQINTGTDSHRTSRGSLHPK